MKNEESQLRWKMKNDLHFIWKPEAARKLKNRNVERARQLGIEYMKTKGVNLEK